MSQPNGPSNIAALTTDALFTLALTEDDQDIAWEAISQLQQRGTSDIFLRAQHLCISSLVRERRLGADILGQLAHPQSTYQEESVQTLLAMLEVEQHAEVLESIGVALGHWADPRAVLPLLQHQHHSDPMVRHGVVFGLLGHEMPQAITALIFLSTDSSPLVRDWATFGLAVQIDTDTAAIRNALAARLNDSDPDIGGEAMVGLARRNDPGVVQPLLDALLSGATGSLPCEAATTLRDPQLYPALVRLRDQWEGVHAWEYGMLEEAIIACMPVLS